MKYLAIAVISKPHTKLVYELSKFVRAAGCNILESHWYTPGGEAMGSYLVAGNWNAIAKLETGLPSFERKHEVALIPRRVEIAEPNPNYLPYVIYITALDRPGILEEVMAFLVDEEVNIFEINGGHFQARHTLAQMMS